MGKGQDYSRKGGWDESRGERKGHLFSVKREAGAVEGENVRDGSKTVKGGPDCR